MKKDVWCFLIFAGLLICTSEMSGKKKPAVDFWPVEEHILRLIREIRLTKNDSLAIEKHRMIEEALAQTLTQPEAYRYPFDSLRMIGFLYAPHRQFRLINWNHSFRDGTHRYFAMIVVPEKQQPSRVIRLTDMSDTIRMPEFEPLAADEWYGALYYKIIRKRKAKDEKKYYTFLGVDMNNLDTKKKIVEVMAFEDDGTVRFGAPLFELNGRVKHRLIFEYSARQAMYLEYKSFRRRIEYDHLSPLMPYYVGMYEYYEPDMYRDGLKFKRKRWKHYKNIVTPPKEKKLKKRSLPKPPKIKRPKPVKKQTEQPEKPVDPEDTTPMNNS
ncbi:MAG: hypothetical protein LBR08_06670 [Bacteroidales bacterium]|jgi:hypothetical protein|nr:hypothetical protein [Bacteroidales bacterium]